MNIKKGLLIIALLLVSVELSYSWNEEVTHKDISRFAAENSVLRPSINYLKNIGYQNALDEKFQWNGKTLKVKEWLQEGAKQEDIPTSRSFNHFHNPLRLWSQAGLDDWFVFHLTGKSSLLWAQDGSYQQSSVNEDWSWQKTREYFYTALTSMNDSLRQENFARTFMGLGHQMHLLQDTAVPDHVRNDAHPEDAIFGRNPFNGSAFFESWAKSEQQRIIDLASDPNLFISPNVSFNVSYNGLAPTTQLFDAEEYSGVNPSVSLTQGLAEYTNANFFSGDTIFAAERYSSDHRHYFPYPKRSSTDLQNYLAGTKPTETIIAEDGSEKTVVWISKIADGETIAHFIRPGGLTKIAYALFGEGSRYYSTFYRDEKCHEDYVEKLIPRAVGYSAGLLDYFFRGKLNIIQISKNTFQIVNPSDEDIEGNLNSFKLYYDDITDNRYEIPLAFLDSSGNQYTDQNTVLLIPKQTTGSFTVKLLSTPANPKNTGEYILVFKGRIGKEGASPYDKEYAVAGQLVTPHFLTHVEVNGQWDIYEYDLLGNRIYNLTGNLSRGIAYYDGIPNPVNPDLLMYLSDSGCSSGGSCLHLLTKSTGQVVNMNRSGVFWWSKDGQKIYRHEGYDDNFYIYDLSTGTWDSISAQSCGYWITYSSFSSNESKLVSEGMYYNPSTGNWDIYDILILTNWDLTHVIDMKTMSLVPVDVNTCSGYRLDEDFMDAIPDFHPSDDKIIFTSDADGAYNIYLVDLAFGAMQRLTNAPSGERGYFEATWSPDGERILMAGGDPSEIYLMPAAGGTPTRITNEGIKHYFPKWIRYLGQ